MRILAAGAASKLYRESILEVDLSKLYSALSEGKHIREWPRDKFLMVDSGAHSWNKTSITKVSSGHARKKLPDLKDWCKKYLQMMRELKDSNFVFVELDCYGNIGIDFTDEMLEQVKLIGGSFQYIRVYHPVLDNGDLSTLKRWISDGHKYIGIGNDSDYLLDKIFSITKDEIKLHGFAMTKDDLLLKYPFYSCDSTTPLSIVKFGSMYEYRLHQKSKDEYTGLKMINVVKTEQDKLKDALFWMKQSEIFYTKVWEKRGVVWKE
jgi:hypothetical protein